jgi:hypothetical protein
MTRDDIIRMAREADPGFETDTFHAESLVGMEAIERFAALVAAAEREACAKVADDMTLPDWVNEQIATAIRARGQE